MIKQTLVISCPIDTYSGYGARSRDFVKAVINLNKYEVRLLSQRWGNTRSGYLADHNETKLSNLIIDKVNTKPDIWIQITVPNEFAPVGVYNIGVTAGMETTLVHGSWIEGCNRMDLIITSSQHSKRVFAESKFEKVDQKTNKVLADLKLIKPVEVLFEGADLSKYFPTKSKMNCELNVELDQITESFCFLTVGHWMQGKLGHDRKNIGYTIKSFLEVFKNKRGAKPALILKTQEVGTSNLDRNKILDKIEVIRKSVKGSNLPNIYLLHGDLTDAEMNELYNHPKVKAMVSHTKGEGFGRPLLEFSLTGKPIIASGWSGQLDFLTPELALLLGGKLDKLNSSSVIKDILIPESSWFFPDDAQTNNGYKQVYKKYKEYHIKGKRLKNINREKFSFEAMQSKLSDIFTEYIKESPKQVKLELPKLKMPKLVKNG